jgi:hypothetical protein
MDEIEKLNDPVLSEICASKYFLMNQHSDINDNNIFDHVTFVGMEPIESIMKQEHPFLKDTNEVVIDTYVQLFLSEKVFRENKELLHDERNGVNYSVVETYTDVFKGFIRNKDFFILLNTDNFDGKYGVFILINNGMGKKFICNNADIEIEFYGFINIGYLINTSGYRENVLQQFESDCNFTIPDPIRMHVENSPIIKYNKQLFHIDLVNYNSSVKNRCSIKTKNFTNATYVKAMTDEDNSDIEKENSEFINQMCNGFLYLGLINKISLPFGNKVIDKRTEKLYLMMNYEEQVGVDYTFSLWKHSMINGNASKVLDIYTDENAHKSLEEFEAMEEEYNVTDQSQIFYAMKFMENV